jgi:hypothetical protein
MEIVYFLMIVVGMLGFFIWVDKRGQKKDADKECEGDFCEPEDSVEENPCCADDSDCCSADESEEVSEEKGAEDGCDCGCDGCDEPLVEPGDKSDKEE